MRTALVAMLCLTCSGGLANVLENSSFEIGSGNSAAAWGTALRSGQVKCIVADGAHSGRRCVAVTGQEAGMALWYNHDIFLMEGVKYRFSCWVKTEGAATGRVYFAEAKADFHFKDTPEWKRLAVDFTAEATGRVGMHLEGYGRGTAFFDDVVIEILERPALAGSGVIATDGEPLVGIVVPDSTELHEDHLGLDVRRVLKKMTGVDLPVIGKSAAARTPGRYIYIGRAADAEKYAADLAKVGDEGIVLDVSPAGIVCLGNTPRGVYYAVQEFLYLLGCRWYMPWKQGECIPSTTKLALPSRKIVHSPSFKLRGNKIVHGYHFPPDMKESHVDFYPWVDWAARNRMNGLGAGYPQPWPYGAIRGHSAQDFAGHSLYTILPPGTYFDEHPEYYPLVDRKRTTTTPWGQRPANFCVSNEEVIQLCADYAIEFLDSHPYAWRFGIGQNDVGANCECDKCKALDPPGSIDWSKKTTDILPITDRWLWFINRVAEKVEKRHPKKYVQTFAYADSLTRPINPANNPRRNVMMELTWSFTNLQDLKNWRPVRCFKHAMNDPDCPMNAEGMSILAEWSKLAPMSIYSYFLYYNNRSAPGAYCHADTDFYRALFKAGVRHISDEAGTDHNSSPLLLNLRARVMWDVDTNVDRYVDEFCRIVYGPAAAAVKRHFDVLERSVADTDKSHANTNDLALFTPEVLAEAHAALDEADRLGAGDQLLLNRLARLRIALHYAEILNLDPATDQAKVQKLKVAATALISRYGIPIVAGSYGALTPKSP